ncbi:MAG: lipocalin family protein [Gammaproteobacteria bacterium]|nr:lipocalin family protein [Gammaproteobacteria bacterium]MDH5344395.1 lipocalin family protein [Gammaproteobacteria bacterium]
MSSTVSRFSLPVVAALLSACAGGKPPLPTVEHVDLPRFMGDWFVIANIPTFLEKGAHNAVETYALNPDGSISTTFVFRKDGFDGKVKEYTPTGYVTDTDTNAVWGMRFIWPIKADYRIVYLDEDYSRTVIARNKRDFVWIMARTPTIADNDYDAMIGLIEGMGYDVSAVQKVPQRW